jgi:hypothetical protein
MDEARIKTLIDQGIQTYMNNKQFNLSKVPNHEHNGTDTVKVPVSSIKEAIPITGSAGGVFNSAILGDQTINRLYNSNTSNPSFVYSLPSNIIYGFGVGVDSAFNGGLAEEGTMIVFSNGALSTLWFMLDGTWRGVSLNLSA